MAQSFSQTIKTNFNKGFLTEFSELNFPEEASIDELNCDLLKSGNRTKRKAILFEEEWETYPSASTFVEGTLFHTATWSNVGGYPSIEYLVVQGGNKLLFYRKGSVPLSSAPMLQGYGGSVYELDMSPFALEGGTGAGTSKIEVASIEGNLIVVSPQINSFYISRDFETGLFSTTLINFKVRDFGFYGDPDKRLSDVSTAFVTDQRIYDTENSGWVGGADDLGTAALDAYIAANSTYPPLTHPWYSGKNSSGNFDQAEWSKVYGGSSVGGLGHYIIDLFTDVRTLDDGTTFTTTFDGSPIQQPKGRMAAVASYAGRAWYAGVDSRVYYSKILENVNYIGDCFQHNDPTSEFASDPLATDGGYINIPEAAGIRKLHVFGSSLLVFADNGVWRVSGVDGNLFKADDFSVFKITDFGLAIKSSFISAQNSVPFWWSYTGIHTIQVTEQGGMTEVNISRDTIQTFWNNISPDTRGFVTGIYDAIDNKLLWMYPNEDELIPYKLNNILILDATLGAFYPWKITDKPEEEFGQRRWVVGASFFSGKGAQDIELNVTDSEGNLVVDTFGNQVVVTREAGVLVTSEVYFVTFTATGRITFSQFRGEGYLDWETADYDAYAESAYNFVGDLGRKKNSPYITVFMKQTETGFEANGDTFDPVNPSSLLVSAYWDFRKEASSDPQEVYRHKQPIVVDSLTSFPSPTTILSTRLKLRGRGRVVRIRFQGVPGKNFNLLGWETMDAKNRGY